MELIGEGIPILPYPYTDRGPGCCNSLSVESEKDLREFDGF